MTISFNKIRLTGLRALRYLLHSDKLADKLGRVMTKGLLAEIRGEATDDFLDIVMLGLQAAFVLVPGYKDNIEGFDALYVFCTEDGKVSAAAQFSDGHMRMTPFDAPSARCDARVIFRSPKALSRFLLSKDQDILDSVLENSVHVEGNLNYVYRFGFFVRDLERRLTLN